MVFVHYLLIYISLAVQIGWITSDGASVNTAMMTHIARSLNQRNIDFDAKDRRIFCLPHVLHVCVGHILKSVGGGGGANRGGDDEASDDGLDDDEIESADTFDDASPSR